MTPRVQASLGSTVVPLKRAAGANQVSSPKGELKGARDAGLSVDRTARPRVGTALRLSDALGFAGQVLDDMGARLDVAIQTGKAGFTRDTVGSVQRVAEMTRLSDPVQWPDVPPREIEAGEVLLPLRERLAESLRTDLYQLDLEEADPEAMSASIDDARRRLDAVSKEMEQDVEGVVRSMFQVGPSEAPDVDELRREVRRGLSEDAQNAVKEAAGVGAEDVLALVR